MWREGGGIGKGPRDGNRTRVAVSTDVLNVGALTTRISAQRTFSVFESVRFEERAQT